MSNQNPIYLATVCLDRNRWDSHEPSFDVSDWLPRFLADGFDGIELWESHDLRANGDERAKLIQAAAPLAVYNAYAGFTSDSGDVEKRNRAAEAITRFRAGAVKYNLGADVARIGEYRSNLLAWADQVSSDCRLLCECHSDTVLEEVNTTTAFFADLDPTRFGVIAHLDGDAEKLDRWLGTLGGRVQHLHVQLREAEIDPAMAEGKRRLSACAKVLGERGYAGSATIEFTRGIGRGEDIETLYANALVDLAWCRSVLAG